MATEQEKATAKAKALDGGMDPAAADKIFQMGSKGEFYMKPGHSNTKSMSELNMSNKDALMMSALLHKADPPGHVHGGSTEFKIDEGGATLSNVDTKTSVVTTPKSSSANIKVVDKGEDAFYNNLISSSKDMNAMVSQGIDPKDKKAVINYGNKKFEAMNQSSGGGTSINISQNKDEKKDTNNIGSILSEGQREMDKFIGKINLQNYGTEMDAKRDSTSVSNQVRMDLIGATTDRSPKNLSVITDIAGLEGNIAANKVRKEGNIPVVRPNTTNAANSWYGKFDISAPSRDYQFPSGFGGVNQKNQVVKHPVFSKENKDSRGNMNDVTYTRDGQLYIDSNIKMKPLKMSYQGSKKK